jgi:hypothetical protein
MRSALSNQKYILHKIRNLRAGQVRQQDAAHHLPITLRKFTERRAVTAPCRLQQLPVLGKVLRRVFRWQRRVADLRRPVNSCNRAKIASPKGRQKSADCYPHPVNSSNCVRYARKSILESF